jgi:uncharacterized protein YecE (DUF72 family)
VKGKILIGTSGFSYKDWIGRFYPEDLPSNQWLEFYSQNFTTLEFNNTFYRIPRPQTFINWKKRVPSDFVFSVKVNQRITHWKRLKIDSNDWGFFWQRASLLGEKLGVLLFQLPPSFKKDSQRLAKFLEQYKPPVRFAFEFRHQSWFDQEIYQILKAFNCSLVFHDAQAFPRPPFKATADFVYIRFHGQEVLYNYEYSSDQLKGWAEKIIRWQKQGRDIFAYFNNDPEAFAVKNAKELLEMVEGQITSVPE